MRHAVTLSAAFVAFAAIATLNPGGAQAAGQGKYCLTQALSKAKNCSYKTMAQCIRSKGAPADDCSLYNGTTTGSAMRKRMHSGM